jgi:hypothetical protein
MPRRLGRAIRKFIYLKEKGQKDGDWIHLVQNRVQWWLFGNTIVNC